MLHILVGPSGVGKTTIIRELMYNYSWNPIVTYCTRKTRVDDINKIFTDHNSFRKLKKAGFFYSVQSVQDNYYGQPKGQITSAVESKSNWIFDISYDYIENFQKIDCTFYVILCESSKSLTKRLEIADRTHRIDSAIKEHEKLSNIVKGKTFPHKLIVNSQGKIDKTISKFRR